MKQYRVPFFEALARVLAEHNIELTVAFGEPTIEEATKGDSATLSHQISRPVKNYWLFNGKLLIQNVCQEIIRSDVVIVEHANKHLVNYPLLLGARLGLKSLAFWGHGYNRQARKSGFEEWLKHQTLNMVGWWFAYTQGTADYLKRNGFPSDRITVVQNSVDTSSFEAEVSAISEENRSALRLRLGILPGDLVGLFCGSLYGDKKLHFLVDAARLLREQIPNFHLIIVGDGPERDNLRHYVGSDEWIHIVGSQFGFEKAVYFGVSDVVLNPGLVGLAILDAFVAALPVFTTDIPVHSPEIEYLLPGVNGDVTPFSLQEYVDAVVRYLHDPALRARLKEGAKASAARLTLDVMVANFKHGILAFLDQSGRRGR
ncbi:glycosyltransferase family 4 protein [bacterium]|nr:glycosyltransferase family 4 protein [bacterium]